MHVEASEMDPGLDDLNAEPATGSQAHGSESSAFESGRAEGEPASSFYSRLKAEGVAEIDLEAVLGESHHPQGRTDRENGRDGKMGDFHSASPS